MQKYIAVEDLRRAVAALPDTENGYSDTYDKETILGLIEDQPGIEIVKTAHLAKGGRAMQTWGEFNLPVSIQMTGQVLTDIQCPQCQCRIYLDDKIVMTTYPVEYLYRCPCGWVGTSPRRWTKEESK